MAPSTTNADKFILPTLAFGMVEIHRLQRELEALEESLRQASLRTRDPKAPLELPRVSRLLDALAAENHCDLMKPSERESLVTFLNKVVTSAPSIHISFAADPSAAFTAKIVGWLRNNVHPLVLLQLGLQPTIAAGCIVRTTNKQFDLSLRNSFISKRQLLMSELEGKTA